MASNPTSLAAIETLVIVIVGAVVFSLNSIIISGLFSLVVLFYILFVAHHP